MASTGDPFDTTASILRKWDAKLSDTSAAERQVERAIEATASLEQQHAERERTMEKLIASLQEMVSAVQERVSRLSEEAAEGAERNRAVEGEKDEVQEELEEMMERMHGYQESVKRLQEKAEDFRKQRQDLESDLDYKTSKIRKELLLFSSLSQIRWDYSAQDRFKGVKIDSSSSTGGDGQDSLTHVDLDASEVARVATTYQMWSMC